MKAGGLTKDDTIWELKFTLSNFRANALATIWRINRRVLPKHPELAESYGAERDDTKRAMRMLELHMHPALREEIRKDAAKSFLRWFVWNTGYEAEAKEAA